MFILHSLRIIVFISVISQAAAAQNIEVPNTNAGKLLKIFLTAVKTGKVDEFVNKSFDINMMKEIPAEEHINFLGMIHRMHGGFVVHKIFKSEENKIEVICKSNNQNAWRKFLIETNDASPNKITGMDISETTAPEEYLATLPKLKISRPASDNSIVKGNIAKKLTII